MGYPRFPFYRESRKLRAEFESKYQLTTTDNANCSSVDIEEVGNAVVTEQCSGIVPESAINSHSYVHCASSAANGIV